MLYLGYPTVTDQTFSITPSAASVSASEVRTCSRCGLTEPLLRTEGLLGCATCYETFADLVAQAAEALHGVTIADPALPHTGIDTAPAPASVTAAEPRRKALSWLPRRMQAHLFPSLDSSPLPGKSTKRNAK